MCSVYKSKRPLISVDRVRSVKKDIIMNEKWFLAAGEIAKQALCKRANCGAVIVKDDEIIGSGYSAPPLDDVKNSKCHFEYPGELKKPKSDRTCCMHAEWRAIFDTLKKNPDKIVGSTLYFCRVDDNGSMLKSGEPYCTVCSRLALDSGIAFFALWQEGGIRVYDTREYNDLSYQFHNPKI